MKQFDKVQIQLQVPAHLQNSWESYYMEILMVTGLLAYIMNYIIGKNKNNRLAQAWFNTHRELLESNFALVGKLFCDLPRFMPPILYFLPVASKLETMHCRFLQYSAMS